MLWQDREYNNDIQNTMLQTTEHTVTNAAVKHKTIMNIIR